MATAGGPPKFHIKKPRRIRKDNAGATKLPTQKGTKMSATLTVLRDTATAPAGLVWENPPAKANQPGKYAAIAAALKEHPNQWAVIRTYDTTHNRRAWGFAGSIRDGKFADLRNNFEACARTVDNQVRVYARYTPEVSA